MSSGNRPNTLFIQDDQHHAGLLLCAGHPDVRTPNIEIAGLIGNHLRSLAGTFRDMGYQTAMIGKTHFVPQWPRHGFKVLRKGDACECVHSADENAYMHRLPEWFCNTELVHRIQTNI